MYNIAIYYDDISVAFDNVKQAYIDSDKVIKTKKATFNIAGNISSYSSINIIEVNGDIVFMNRYYKFANNEQQLSQKFNFDYNLDKGLNIIKIKIRNICGQVVEKQIKVNFEK